MTLKELSSLVCDDLIVDVAEHHGREFIITNFSYADGDLINVYMTGNHLSDFGTTLHKLRVAGVRMTEHREEVLRSAMSLHGLTMEGNDLLKRFHKDTVARDFQSFCEAIVRISMLETYASTRETSMLPHQVEFLMKEKVRPKRRIETTWYAPVDIQRLYPVDYHLNTSAEHRNIFVIASRQKSLLAVTAMFYFKAKEVWAPTMSIVDSAVHGKSIQRLEQVSDAILVGVSGNEDRIVEFALEGMSG